MIDRLKDLHDLQSSKDGRAFLLEQGIHCDPETFVEQLKPPANGGPVTVYAHQQVYFDYRSSVLAKIVLLRSLAQRRQSIECDFVWIDTDRAGSDKLGLRFYVSTDQRPEPVRFAPAGAEKLEPRFINMDRKRVAQALERLWQLSGSGCNYSAGHERFEMLSRRLLASETLADCTRNLTDVLLGHVLGFVPQPVLTSDLARRGDLTVGLECILNNRVAFIAAVNTQVQRLRELGINPQVSELSEDYLPLFMTCPDTRQRLRLNHECRAGHSHACTKAPDGKSHAFPLGRRKLSWPTYLSV